MKFRVLGPELRVQNLQLQKLSRHFINWFILCFGSRLLYEDSDQLPTNWFSNEYCTQYCTLVDKTPLHYKMEWTNLHFVYNFQSKKSTVFKLVRMITTFIESTSEGAGNSSLCCNPNKRPEYTLPQSAGYGRIWSSLIFGLVGRETAPDACVSWIRFLWLWTAVLNRLVG